MLACDQTGCPLEFLFSAGRYVGEQARDSFLGPSLNHLYYSSFPCGSKRTFVPVTSYSSLKFAFLGPISQILALERNDCCYHMDKLS